MTIWIVLKNGKVDEVFDNKESAVAHQQALIKKWALTNLVEKEVKSV
jgi:hypothetical protein